MNIKEIAQKCKKCSSENIEYYDITLAIGYVCNDCTHWDKEEKYEYNICCKSPKYEPVLKTISNGTKRATNQCSNCGSKKGWIKKDKSIQKEFNEKLYENHLKNREKVYSMNAYLYKKSREIANSKQNLSYKKYQEYLKSKDWREKRKVVLKRDNYICQGCFENKATEVHHLNYDNLYDELFFQLVSLCNGCHTKIHN